VEHGVLLRPVRKRNAVKHRDLLDSRGGAPLGEGVGERLCGPHRDEQLPEQHRQLRPVEGVEPRGVPWFPVLERCDGGKAVRSHVTDLLGLDVPDQVIGRRHAGHTQVGQPDEKRLSGRSIGRYADLERGIRVHTVDVRRDRLKRYVRRAGAVRLEPSGPSVPESPGSRVVRSARNRSRPQQTVK
jgi:hypothetical protein